MPFLSHLMPVGLPEETARSYFLQLTNAIAYLHDRGISKHKLRIGVSETRRDADYYPQLTMTSSLPISFSRTPMFPSWWTSVSLRGGICQTPMGENLPK